jgi:hypothetical protein
MIDLVVIYHIRVFCELCAKEVGAGNIPGPFLSAKGYKNLEESFFQQTKKRYVKEKNMNRWDSLKKEYTQWKELKIAASGLGWHYKLENIVADSNWRSVHLQVFTCNILDIHIVIFMLQLD